MKLFCILLLATFIVVGCTTSSPEAETKPELITVPSPEGGMPAIACNTSIPEKMGWNNHGSSFTFQEGERIVTLSGDGTLSNGESLTEGMHMVSGRWVYICGGNVYSPEPTDNGSQSG